MGEEKQLPQGWVKTELNELIDFVLGGDWGKDPSKQYGADYTKVYCIRGSEIRNWDDEKGSTASLRVIKESSLAKRKLQIGDILVEISGGGPDQPVGRTVIIDEEALNVNQEYPKVCTNFLRLVRATNQISKQYLNYYLTEFYLSGQVVAYQGGSNNLRNLKFKDYVTIKVPLPPLPEQHRIVAKLDALMARVAVLEAGLARIPQLLADFRQSVLSKAVTGELTREWRAGKVLENRFQRDHKLPMRRVGLPLPKAWTWLPFNAVATVKSNLVQPMEYEGFPLIAPDNIQPKTGRLLNKPLVEEIKPKSPKHLFTSGTIVYSKIRPYLSKLIIADFEGLCSADMYPIATDLNLQYLFYYMLSDEYLTYANTSGERTVLPKINQKELGIIPIPVPPIEEQAEIVRRVESLFAQADAIEARYTALKKKVETLPPAILAKAFRGELVPQLPEDGDARALLAEIRALREERKGKGRKKKK